ncbi:hypothetical protein QO002_005510 [Pararhizobium capsulatum DSM 1112]|uniref:Uncharacterized protein n=1 Tax=Pararhizobium capsulatum DSM 1112 TaxID=1121113 RepID=A0ABU0C025_9HYPH|nr:hypothetical protein [Pararhizobium capsulatum]MDQ0323304.1 hypothetical protein [Pararhizobium capsulatum DSM 1112]
MTNDLISPADDLHEIVERKLVALVSEMENADWNALDVAHAINNIIQSKWLHQAERLQAAQDALSENFVSDGNEG